MIEQRLILIKTGLTRENSIAFKNKDEQLDYFRDKIREGLIIDTGEDLYKGSVTVEHHVTELESYDYMVLEDEYGIRYAFIEDIIYLNRRNSEILFTIDSIQTYLIGKMESIKSMKIRREHMEEVNNTVEPIEATKFITTRNKLYPGFYFLDNKPQNGVIDKNYEGVIPIVITVKKESQAKYNSQPSVMPYKLDFYLSYINWDYQNREFKNIHLFPDKTATAYKLLSTHDLVNLSTDDKIVDISFLPFSYEEIDVIDRHDNYKELRFKYFEKDEDYKIVSKIAGTEFTDSYALLLNNSNTYPVSLSEGTRFNFKDGIDPKVYLSSQYTDFTLKYGNLEKDYELINLRDPKNLRVESMIGFGPTTSLSFSVMGYDLFSLNTTDSPHSVPLVTNDFINYMKNEKYSRNTRMIGNVASAVVSTGIGVATGGAGAAIGASSAMGVASSFASEIAKKADLKRRGQTTNTVKDNVDLTLMTGTNIPVIEYLTPADEELIRISDFFKLYGYSNNRVGKPKFVREDWNYIEASDIVFDSDFGRVHVNDIIERFNNGIRLWSKDSFLDFDRPNKIRKE